MEVWVPMACKLCVQGLQIPIVFLQNKFALDRLVIRMRIHGPLWTVVTNTVPSAAAM